MNVPTNAFFFPGLVLIHEHTGCGLNNQNQSFFTVSEEVDLFPENSFLSLFHFGSVMFENALCRVVDVCDSFTLCDFCKYVKYCVFSVYYFVCMCKYGYFDFIPLVQLIFKWSKLSLCSGNVA